MQSLTAGSQSGTSWPFIQGWASPSWPSFFTGLQQAQASSPSTGYYNSFLDPLAGQLFTGGGLGYGAPYLGSMASLLNEAANTYEAQIPYIQQGAAGLAAGFPALGAAAQTTGATLEGLSPYATGQFLDQGNPYLQQILGQIQSEVSNQVGGQFAAAGRDFSGDYSNAMARGIASGEAQPLFANYNTQQQMQLQALQQAQAAAGEFTNIAGMAGNLGTGYANIGNQLGNVAGGLGTTAQAYGQLPSLYDQMAMNRFNAGAMGTQVLQLMSQLPYASVQNYANLLLPVTSQLFTTQNWAQKYAEQQQQTSKSHSSTSTSGFSDRRLKEDIAQVGSLNDGTPVYRYRFKGSRAFLIGLMADEVKPEAVSEGPLGFLQVDYEKATEASVREEDD